MKLMIASDIHGSAFHCRKLLHAYKKENADKLLLLGDILYHGPRNELPDEYSPKKVIEMLNSISNNIICVRGNCESEVDQMVLEFPCLADYAILCIDDVTFFATHGHKHNEHNLPPLSQGDIFIYGHTHVPQFKKIKENILINPGSVSIPKNNSYNSYVTFENRKFLWKKTDGDIIMEKEIH